MIRLRGHHLLCLLGYRGMGYSEAYSANMTRVHTRLRKEPETQVLIVSGPDDLCAWFPEDQPYHCEDENVHERDAAVLKQLGLEPGLQTTWRELEQGLAKRFVPEDIPALCSTCPWLGYGVCEDGIRRIRAGKGLYPVENGMRKG